ncbi:protein-arginine deiminase family protein [Amycolatopsis sp. lyj-108]|uniref:protein-arginine deiminase family protein n=1 Tax=Amycolatopsis sp. lyj-108 TaxID=2789286 RepID=UPI003978226A
MVTYRLDADYDRDGRVSGRPDEHDLRLTGRGAILVANLDVDARMLPTVVRPGQPVTVDAARTSKAATDNEPSDVRVVEAVPAGGSCPLVLKMNAADAARLAVWEGSHRITPASAGGEARFPLTGPGALRFEAIDLAGAPPALSGLATSQAAPPGPGIQVRLDCDSAAGPQDAGQFTLAPLLFMDNGGQTRRVYICEVADARVAAPHLHENTPAVRDVAAALRPLGVPLVTVPTDVHGGDAWIQDQYQLGYLHGPAGWMYMVLHLPRTRADTSLALRDQNLSTLVTSHFPARDVGVYDAFWHRDLEVRAANGTTSRIAFSDSDRVLTVMTRVFLAERKLLRLIRYVLTGPAAAARNEQLPGVSSDFFTARNNLPRLLTQLERTADEMATSQLWQNNGAGLSQVRTLAKAEVTAATQAVVVQTAPPAVRLRLPATANRPARDIDLAAAEADRLAQRLRTLHSSHNFGGNIEVGPATRDAPLGKVVVGNVTRTEVGQTVTDMDPHLLAFLRGQAHGGQPLVEIDTSWLDVGHVDEVLAFVPTQSNRFGAATLRASPTVAFALIDALANRFWDGLSILERSLYPNPYRYSAVLPRRTDKGTSPVTMLMRGQEWLHDDSPDLMNPIEPPLIYTELAKADAAFQISAHRIPLPHPPQRESFGPFPADVSIFELPHFDDGTNADLEENQLTEIEQRLTDAFGNVPILRLPVIFDNLDKATGTTKAFTPDLANLQVVGDRLLVPRPYGPRARVPDAVAVLRDVAATHRDVEASAFTDKDLRTRRLDRTYIWVRDAFILGNGGDHAASLADAFADGFPGVAQEEARKRIIRANPGAFFPNGNLRSGWRKLSIPEGTVDVFEAWTDAVARSLGLVVQWVDAWYYHIRLGSIHCGTNVIRRPRTDRTSAWWRQAAIPQPAASRR